VGGNFSLNWSLLHAIWAQAYGRAISSLGLRVRRVRDCARRDVARWTSSGGRLPFRVGRREERDVSTEVVAIIKATRWIRCLRRRGICRAQPKTLQFAVMHGIRVDAKVVVVNLYPRVSQRVPAARVESCDATSDIILSDKSLPTKIFSASLCLYFDGRLLKQK
jgi:hypothetical protein